MRKNLFKKSLAMIIALLFIAGSLTGCQFGQPADSRKPDQDTPAPTTAASDPNNGAEENKFEKHLKFSFSGVSTDIAGKEKDGTMARNFKWFCEKFNVEFEFVPLTWGNYIDQTRLYMASGDGPDLMMLDIAPSRYSEYLAWVEGGLLKEYANLDNYPNMKKTLENMVTGQKFMVDGKLYAWPAIMTGLDRYNYVGVNAWYYRRDWAKAVGLYKEGDVYTWEEWLNLVRAVIEQDPGGNGKGKTIGMMSKDYLFPRNFGAGAISPYMLTYTKVDGKWVWGPMLPETLEALKLVKSLYDEGLIWADQPMVKANDPSEKSNAGLLFASAIDNVSPSSWKKTVDNFISANPDLAEQAYDIKAIALVKGPNGKLMTWQKSDQWSQQAMNSRISDEKRDRWMAMVDYMVSEEGLNFIKYGIPGEDWRYDKNGEVEILWTKDAEGNLVKPYTYGSVWWQRAFVTADGIELDDPGYAGYFQDEIHRFYKLFNDPNESTIIKANVDLNYFTGEQFTKVGTKESEIYQKMAALMVSSNLEKDWKEWVESKMPEIQPVLDELNANLK